MVFLSFRNVRKKLFYKKIITKIFDIIEGNLKLGSTRDKTELVIHEIGELGPSLLFLNI